MINEIINLYNSFKNPEFLMLIMIPVLISIWYIKKHKSISSNILFSNTKEINAVKTLRIRMRHFPFILYVLSSIFIIISICRPQSESKWIEKNSEGIDIVLCIDVSSSMGERDLKPNRLEAAKSVVHDFIKKRPNDRIGITLFAADSYRKCPLTLDHNTLIKLKNEIKTVNRGSENDGTAIGDGLITSINAIKNSKSKSKVIILLTDGVNNVGEFEPIDVAPIAKGLNTKIYTIGLGQEFNFDETLLKKIAEQTNGKYFNAKSKDNLNQIYNEIDLLEKTKNKSTKFFKKSEEFHFFGKTALILLSAGFVFSFVIINEILK